MSTKSIALAAGCVAVLVAAAPGGAAAVAHTDRGDGLAKVRKATARFHSVAVARQAG